MNTTALDRADAVAGSPVTIDLLEYTPPSGHATVGLTLRPGNGRVVLNDDVTLTYTSEPGFRGTDTFGYRVVDRYGRSARVRVAVTVREEIASAAALGYAA